MNDKEHSENGMYYPGEEFEEQPKIQLPVQFFLLFPQKAIQ